MWITTKLNHNSSKYDYFLIPRAFAYLKKMGWSFPFSLFNDLSYFPPNSIEPMPICTYFPVTLRSKKIELNDEIELCAAWHDRYDHLVGMLIADRSPGQFYYWIVLLCILIAPTKIQSELLLLTNCSHPAAAATAVDAGRSRISI